jgi:putative RecB family exonuclease
MPTYSHSQLSTYETCPHQYKLAYLDKIKIETEGIEAFMGSRVHDALEKLYRDLKVTKLNTLEEILDYYDQSWEKNWNEMIQIVRKEHSAEDYRSLGKRCITEYYKRYCPFDQGKTLGLEENIYFPLDEEKGYSIRGFIDRLTLCDHSILEIHDYKTSSRLPTQEDVDSNRQLAFYHMGVEGKWKDIQEIRLVWHYLAFDTEISSSRTPEKLQQLRRETMELIQQIESDRQFLPKEGPLCNWCDYRGFCPKRKHQVMVEALPLNEYLNEEGVTLVNRYVAMRERKRLLNEEIDAELVKLEEALYAYVQKEELEAVYGSDHVARIKVEAKEKYPLKGDQRRRALDDLNPWMLSRVIERGKWDSLLVKKVKEFSTQEESRSITVSKLKEGE